MPDRFKIRGNSSSSDFDDPKISWSSDGVSEIQFYAEPGLYQFSVIANAEQFNWEGLYFDLHLFENNGQRTGPWDFNLLDENKPLVPSYWVTLNGERLGLWFFQRVSLEDLEKRRFRGRFAFEIEEAGQATLAFAPYRSMSLLWISAYLEPDPDDHLEMSPSHSREVTERHPGSLWRDEEYWKQVVVGLATTSAMYAAPLKRSFDWVCGKDHCVANDVPLLVAAWKLERRRDGLEKALRAIDDAIALPHWGNPREDGYAHNGDMGAANAMRTLAWAFHALHSELGEDRVERMLLKLRLQGKRFLSQALLQRDYWGGSLLQDHGWRSMFDFGTATLYLLDFVPEAQKWLAFIRPRLRRALEAMPQDGVIPQSSYCSLYLYLNEVAHFRDALKLFNGEDIYEQYPFRLIVDYVVTVLREDASVVIATGILATPFIGGNGFFNQIASKFHDGRAAFLQKRLLELEPIKFSIASQENAYFQGPLWGLFTHDHCCEPISTLPRPTRLRFFEDSAMVHFRDDIQNISLLIRCGPSSGYNAYRRAQGPCDRMESAPGAGHFILSQGALPRLVTPDFGYSLESSQRSCLLIDDRGQYGDIGYPMSLPSKLHRGEEIESVHWNELSGEGRIRLKLGPAYPEELGVISYHREFFIKSDRVICRDHVVLDKPRKLSWLFQGFREIGVILKDDLAGCFGRGPHIYIRPESNGQGLKAIVDETKGAWSYSSGSGRKPFDHLRYDTLKPTNQATVDFLITWK